MKKWIALWMMTLLLLTSTSVAFADVDLSGMSFAELVALKDSLNLAIWESEDWQEVTVPQGVYQVGVDIPAGHWTIAPTEGGYARISCGDLLDDTKKDLSWDGDLYMSESVTSPEYDYYDENSDLPQTDFELEEDIYVVIESGSVIFTPYAGKPSLGFK